MKLRDKLALWYTLGFTLLLGLTFTVIYLGTERYRKDEFFERIKHRTIETSRLLAEVEELDQALLKTLNRSAINSMYEEKILLFDSTGKLLYSSLDDVKIIYSKDVLERLRHGPDEIEMTEGNYEVIGVRIKNHERVYYGITKAYDTFGHSKLAFLKYLLIGTFLAGAILLIIVSFYLSRIIIQPVTQLAEDIGAISPKDLSKRVHSSNAGDEVGFLSDKFNQLLDKVEKAFKFQYHFIHHLSHELKTPLAVMLANTERALAEGSSEAYKNSLVFQKNALMELSHIINAMLDISRAESQLDGALADRIRIDELVFECIDEINFLNSQASFEFKMNDSIESSEELTVSGNSRMLKMALMNLMKNAAYYSVAGKARVEINTTPKAVTIEVINDGPTLSGEEQAHLFTHLFRGGNSHGKRGFGLGLVLAHRIVVLHKGLIQYQVTSDGLNRFVLRLPG